MAKEWHFLASEEKCFVTQESLVSPLLFGGVHRGECLRHITERTVVELAWVFNFHFLISNLFVQARSTSASVNFRLEGSSEMY